MDCRTAHDLLPLYFDGELDRVTGREFEMHLDTCADCRAALIELDALRHGLRNDTPRYLAPQALRERIRMQMPSARPARRVRANWLAIAASWVLAFAAGGTLMSIWKNESTTDQAQNQIARDLFASHWRALAATSPVDVVSTDRHTVKPWFAGKINDAPVVQDFAEQGFALVGGRIDYVGSRRVPVLVYRHGQHLIDVFVLPQADAAAIGKQVQLQGYVLDSVALGEQSAAIVSDMDQAELAHFAQLLGSAK
jgi:anti-sigma factor RsiW